MPNDFSARVHAIITALHETASYMPRLTITREGAGGATETRFHWRLIEDRATFHGGGIPYSDYVTMVARESLMAAPAH
jgi:protein transport protein SEC24